MRCGILIIGSLLWDDSNDRAAWREARLKIVSQVPVRAPFYYGRKSGEKRGHTFTMTFGTGKSSAQGIIVPCVAKIAGIADLIEEANALWRAEDANATAGQIYKSWGCVGALFNPKVTDQKLAADWADHFRRVRAQGVSVIGADGRLGIPWPVTLGREPADFDVILATATKPEADRPTARDVADAWIAQTGGHENYFFENVLHGIRTPDDGDIWCRIQERSPSWLKPEAHKQAVDILRAERVVREAASRANWLRRLLLSIRQAFGA